MGTLYSAITSEMRSQNENLFLTLLGGSLPTISSNFSVGGTYSRYMIGAVNPRTLPTPASGEFTCGQWVKTQGGLDDTYLLMVHANQTSTPNWATVMYILWMEDEQVLELWSDDTGPSWVGTPHFVLRDTVNLSGTKLQRLVNWAHLSFYVHYQTNFVVSAYLDGIQIMSYTASGADEWLTGPNAVTMFRGTGSGVDATYLDDSYVEDVNGEGDQIPEGYTFIMTLPDGAGASAQWTPDSGSNYARVSETTAPDDDTSYIQTATSAQTDSYTFANIVAGTTVGYPFWSVFEFNSVLVQSFYRQVDASEATELSYDHRVWDGALESTDGSFSDDDDFDYHFAESFFPLQPDGSAWDLASFNAMEFGVQSN